LNVRACVQDDDLNYPTENHIYKPLS